MPDLPLYITESALARHLGMPLETWTKLAIQYSKLGLPSPDPLCGLRYRPAVEAFFNRHNRLDHFVGPEPDQRPGIVENLDAFEPPRGRRTRP